MLKTEAELVWKIKLSLLKSSKKRTVLCSYRIIPVKIKYLQIPGQMNEGQSIEKHLLSAVCYFTSDFLLLVKAQFLSKCQDYFLQGQKISLIKTHL